MTRCTPLQPEWLFIVVENDPFVACDIHAIIADAYPGAVVLHETDAAAIGREIDAHGAPAILVADMSADVLTQTGLADIARGDTRRLVWIGDETGTGDAQDWVRLSKPFSTEGLSAAIRRACSSIASQSGRDVEPDPRA